MSARLAHLITCEGCQDLLVDEPVFRVESPAETQLLCARCASIDTDDATRPWLIVTLERGGAFVRPRVVRSTP
jgi:hypothetical protein